MREAWDTGLSPVAQIELCLHIFGTVAMQWPRFFIHLQFFARIIIYITRLLSERSLAE